MDERLTRMSISRDASLRAAMSAIDATGCEIALATGAEGQLLGTLSDGDIRRALLSGASLDDPVASFIVSDPITVTPSVSRAEVLDLMRAWYVSQVPVVDSEGVLVGIHLMAELIGAVDRANWAVILVGGRGTRLAPLTDRIPKPMVLVAGRPILERLILHLVGHGIRRIALATNYMSEVIEAHFGDGRALGCEIVYLPENEPLGTGGPVACLPEIVGPIESPVLVANGDLVTQFSVAELLAHHEASEASLTVGVRPYSHTVPFGVVDRDVAGQVMALKEKPIAEWTINAGVYVLEPDLIGRIPRETEYHLPTLVNDCISRGEVVVSWDLDDDWLDVGRFDDLRRARGDG